MTKLRLNRNQLKYIAIIAMLFDHIGMFFFSFKSKEPPLSYIAAYASLRVIGRLTAPLMLFFLTEGFVHTSSRFKYGARLLVFGLISQVPYALSHHDKLMVMDFNMILTLFVTLMMLIAFESISNKVLKWVVVIVLIGATFACDWGIIGPIMALTFYCLRSDRNAQIKGYAVICVLQILSAVVFLSINGMHWYGELWQAGAFLAIPLLLSYNGEAGSRAAVHKWVFYVFYPLHLLVFWVIKYVI